MAICDFKDSIFTSLLETLVLALLVLLLEPQPVTKQEIDIEIKTFLKLFKNELKSEKEGVLIKGSRFMQISSICNKRIAKKLISHVYDIQFRDKYSINTIALGDSKNDIDMLNSCKYSCLIKNSTGTHVKLRPNKKNVFKSSKLAPDGWRQVLYKLNNTLETKIF